MSALRRGGPRALQQAQRSSLRTSQRRLASDSHAPKPHDPAPATEGFGVARNQKSFYMILIGIPSGYLIYSYTRSDSAGNPLTSLINAYSTKQETWMEMNALHTRMVEQAGHDRNLFNNTPAPNFVDLRFPEAISGGSPFNVRAGWGSANLDKLVEHYREKAFKEEEEKLEKMKRGELPGQPNYKDPYAKARPSGAGDAAA